MKSKVGLVSVFSPVVHGREAVIPFLTGCIPDFELDGSVVQADRLGEEGCADSRLLIFVELAFDETQDQRTFSYCRLPKQHQLELL